MTDKPTYYITTAISYVNGAPHLGHAYEAISTDALARFKRADGYDVKFLTGTDEHGQKVERSAEAAGVAPADFAAANTDKFRAMGQMMEISNDDFIRTTEPRHVKATQAIWQELAKKGDIYEDSYAGWYSISDEAFFTEAELDKQEDGSFRTKEGRAVEWVEEPSYFFRLSAYEDRLLAYYEEFPDFIMPKSRRNEVIGFVKQGLLDLSVSRTTFSWGIPVPGNDKHIVYVWLDALTNYITAVGYPNVNEEEFKKYWPADVHIIGKDILRFHAIYWPAFLMSAGLPLPKRIFVHGFLNLKGQKMSKSLGNVVTSESLVEEFGLDQIRHFLLRDVPYGNDGSYSREAIIHRINGDLANGIGNLAQRTLSMIFKNCDATIPAAGALTAEDEAILEEVAPTFDKMREAIDRQAIHQAIEAVWVLIGAADRYLAGEAPWVLRKTDPERMASVLYVAAEVIRNIGIMVQPFMPTSAGKLLNQLGVAEDDRQFTSLGDGHRLAAGTKIEQPQGLFPRINEEKAE
jgi:methionyl-tRNA synthetase